jgi:hypothetical protein
LLAGMTLPTRPSVGTRRHKDRYYGRPDLAVRSLIDASPVEPVA